MNFNFVTNVKSCYDFVNDVAPLSLVYYSHAITAVAAILLGIFVLASNRFLLINRLLFLVSVLFVIFVGIDLITWTSYNSINYMFFWAFFGIVTSLLYLSCVYFAYVFINKKNIPFKILFVFFILTFPILLLTPTVFNLTGFSDLDCISVEVTPFTLYFHGIGVLSFFWIIYLGFIGYTRSTDLIFKKQILLMTVGINAFILTLFAATFLDVYFVSAGLTGDYMFGNYGLFGMPIFIAVLSFLIVKFKAFNIKLIGAQALTWALVIFIGSQFLYMDKMPTSSLVITAITLVMSAGIGLMIVRGIKKEIAIRERIESLADQLEQTNERLRVLDQQKTQFVSLASHQLRAPLTAIKGYLSMILEGDYGKVEGETRDMIERVEQSADNLVTIVGDFLDVSRIEQGRMRYEFSDFDLKELVETVHHELLPVAEKKGLALALNIEDGIEFKVHADKNKLKQVFTNLVDNSIKYTPKGEVKISLARPMPKVVRFEIKDTGIGISAETMPKLFDKFVRAEGANDVNVIGTGLGLFVAKEMIKAHDGGKVWAESEGLGKGSKFIVELKAI